MKALKELVEQYKLVIWDGVSPIKCTTGIFQADEIKKHWSIRPGMNCFYITGRNSTVAKMFGTDLGSPYDSEDVVECGKIQIRDLVTDQYRQQPDADQAIECDMQTVEDNLLVVDMRV